MRHSFLVRLLLVTSAVTVFNAGAALAQFTPDISQGDYPGATYLGSDYEHVDPATGRVYLHIPLLTDHSQRGDLNFPYNVSWSGTGTWVTTCYSGLNGTHICAYWPSAEGVPNTLAYLGPAPVMDGGVSTCPSSCNRSATNPIGVSDGGVHIAYQLPSQSLQRTTDGSGILVSTSSPFAVTDKLGRVFTNPSLIPIVTDRNGNRMTMSANGPGFASGEFAPQLNSGKPANSWTLTDTVGRSWSYAPAANASSCPSNVGADRAQIWTTPGPSGSTRTFEFCFSPVSISTNLPISQGSGVTTHQYVSTTEFLSAIVLPDGTNWQFQYNDSYGDLTKLVLPTGGTITYQYTTTTDPYAQETSLGFFSYIRTVTSRAIFDGTNSNTWSYAAAPYSYPNPFVYTVTDPLGNGTVYTGGTISSGTSTAKIQYYTGSASSGTLLKTVNKTYLQSPPGTFSCWLPALPLSTTTTWPNGQSSSVTLTYDSGFQFTCNGGSSTQSTYGSVTSTTETDYSGSTLRQTSAQYEWQVNSSFLTANWLSFPYQVGVTGSGGTASVSCFFGTAQSCTTYGYDGIGNNTSVTQSLNTGPSPVTQYAYNGYGMRTKITDPKNNITNYGYDSSGVCVNLITNALGQSDHFTCDSNTEQITSHTDANGNATTYSYDDMLRPVSIGYPDTGQTSFSYPTSNEVVTTEKMNASQNIVSTLIFDGLGRPIQTQLNSDPDGTDYTDTTYDGDGRIHSVSNPYRTHSDPTYGITTYLYDPLNRGCLVAPPDATPPSGTTCPTTQPADTIFTVYSGNSATVADEQGKTRESFTDGLGRLTSVIENPGGLNYTTTYGYDALDDLTSVSQNSSRNRAFVYDSLSRLTSATNPESGTTSYTYDADSNVATRVDARSITTTYTYDALNRLASKTYSDGTTPGAYFYYDQSSWNGITLSNGIGRLTSQGVYNGSQWLASSAFSYDRLGRVTNNPQWTLTINSILQVPYTYDLVGDMTTYGNGASWLTFTQSFNLGGRVTSLTSSWVDSQHPGTLVSGAHYNAAGGITSYVLGNNLMETAAYNGRVQPCRMNVNSSGTLLSSCTASVPSGNVLDLTPGFNYGSGDNGNAMSWAATGQQTFSRTYTYDGVNRVATMSAPGSTCSGLSWTYDAWGNRTDQTVTSGTCNTFHQSVDGNNRILGSPYQYDAAGNMTHDASHSYTYDAENRITKVDGGSTATYGYDVDGRRVSRVVAGVETDYIYDLSGHVVADYGGGCGATCWRVGYVYLNGEPLAEYFGGTYFVHTDHLGSTRLLTNYPTPTVAECDDYYPFGEHISCSGAPTPISVQNPSFETYNPLNQPDPTGPYNYGPIPNWTLTGTGGSWQPNSTAWDPPLPDGTIVAFVTSGSISQTLTGVSLAANSTYTLSVYVGEPKSGHSGTFSIQLLAGSTVLATLTGDSSTFPNNTWAKETLTYSAGSNPPPGDISIELTNTGGYESNFDDVQLTASGSASATTTHLFTGYERDSETGLDNAQARYDSSAMGRFMSPDPNNAGTKESDPQTWNGYSYVRNNPLNAADPDGLDCVYLSDLGNSVESIDQNSGAGECSENGGYWVDQTANANSFHDYGNGFASMQNTNGTSYLLCTGGDCSQPPPFSMGGPPNDAISNDPLFDSALFAGLGGLPGLIRGGASLFGELFGVGVRAGTEVTAQTAASTGISEVAAILQKAGSAIGDQGIQASSRDVAEQAAQDWVGAGARDIVDRQTGQAVGKISADGTKIARFTSANKAQPYVNLVNKLTGGNLHVRF